MVARRIKNPGDPQRFVCKPLIRRYWNDFVRLFSEPGVQNGCWCMYWRMKRSEFHRCYGAKNKMAMQNIVFSGDIPGIIAYEGQDPIGWCSVARREDFPVLDRSHTLKRVDDKPVWSITCFFVARNHRGRNMTQLLTKAAVEYAKSNGARIIEAYPIFSIKSNTAKWEIYTGLVSTFERLGFKIAAQRSKIRPIMRLFI